MNAGDQEHEALGVAPTLQRAGPAGSLDEFLDTRGPAADTVPGGIDPEAVEFDVVRDAVRARLFPSLKQRRCIGRYELLRPLGSGGMGMVLAARDPELERDVAVKVLHRAHAEDETRASRLLREARAIARVAHPNVVAVHDAGVHDGQVFLVMELVEGATLRGWLERPRSWLEIVDKLLAAGRGLAAAHAAGVVHRDFKPANVLVGRNGRPRVVDFGLARPTSDEPRRDAPAGEGAASEALVGSLTVTGAVMGTPAYMAPEQLIGAAADTRSDQFSYCVTLYEALFGCRPFTGETLPELSQSLLHAPLRFPDDGGRVPPQVRVVLARGLSRRVEERFESVEQLLDALRDAVAPARADPRLARSVALEPAGELPETSPSSRGLSTLLDELPRGLVSYPECQVRPTTVRLALARQPIDDDALAAAPVELRHAHAIVRGGPEWIPEVAARLVLAAIFERRGDSLDSWIAFTRLLLRSTLSTGFFAFVVQPRGSSQLARSLARVWSSLHRGTELAVSPAREGVVMLSLRAPPALRDGLARAELRALVAACLELARVTTFDMVEREGDGEAARFELAWR